MNTLKTGVKLLSEGYERPAPLVVPFLLLLVKIEDKSRMRKKNCRWTEVCDNFNVYVNLMKN